MAVFLLPNFTTRCRKVQVGDSDQGGGADWATVQGRRT